MKNVSDYKFMFGRQYSSFQAFSLRTFHSIQVTLWEKYSGSSIYFYKDYVYFKHDGFPVWIEAKEKHSVIQGIIAIPNELLSHSDEEIIKNKGGKIADDLFEQIIHQMIRVNNPEDTVVTKSVMSLEAMKKGRDISYHFQDVRSHYNRGYTLIHKISPYDMPVITTDVVASLVTNQEIQVIFS